MSVGVLFLIFAILLCLSVPISSSVAISAMLPVMFDNSFTQSGTYVIREMLNGINSFPMLAIPMFVLSGIIMARGGISKQLFDFCIYLVGNRRAGMPCAAILTCLFYSSMTGSAPATVAAVGSMTIPILVELGYNKTFAATTIAVAGGVGVILPPSIPMILYCMSTGESVSKLFIAGILPSFVFIVCLMCYAVFYCWKHGEDREKIDAAVSVLKAKGFAKIFKESIWALLAPVIILGSIYTGVASPTEAATISVVYALFVSIFIYKSLKVSKILNVMIEAIGTYSRLLFILAASIGLSRILTVMRVPQTVSSGLMDTFGGNKWTILLAINILLLVIGLFMDTTPSILIMAPILHPLVTGLGVDPIHFGIIMVVNLAIGFVTPPIGVNLIVASSLTGVPMMDMCKKAAPYIIMCLFCLALLTIIPQISLVLVG